MDNENNVNGNINNLNKAASYINSIYDKQSYTDLYGSSILIVIISTIVVLIAVSFSLMQQNKVEIAADWTNQRCNPKYIPFAGYIVTPEGKTPAQYTSENFQYCLQNKMVNMTSTITQPQVFLLNSINEAFTAIGTAINNLRGALSVMRDNITNFVKEVMGRIMNIIAPLLKILIAMMDSLHKTEGIMAASLYTALGSYYAIKSFIGAFFEIMITILGILIGVLIALSFVPLMWPVLLGLMVPVLGLSAFMSFVIAIWSITFHLNPIKVPKLKLCFDKNTLFTMYSGETKKISEIKPGDILDDSTRITATMKLDLSNNKMYSLNGVIVSEYHQVKYKNQWIFVKDHPESIEIYGYKEPFIYCLNTSSKEILLNGLYFLDWDELYDNSLQKVLNFIGQNKCNSYLDIHRHLDIGFTSDFVVELLGCNKYITDIKIGDILKTGGKVYGIVEIDGSDLIGALGKNNQQSKLYHLLSSNQIFSSNGQIINDYNNIINFIL